MASLQWPAPSTSGSLWSRRCRGSFANVWKQWGEKVKGHGIDSGSWQVAELTSERGGKVIYVAPEENQQLYVRAGGRFWANNYKQNCLMKKRLASKAASSLCLELFMHFMDRQFFVLFFKLKAFGIPESSKSSIISPRGFAHFISLFSHPGNDHSISNFSVLLYLLWWSLIHDLWCYYCSCFRLPPTMPI